MLVLLHYHAEFTLDCAVNNKNLYLSYETALWATRHTVCVVSDYILGQIFCQFIYFCIVLHSSVIVWLSRDKSLLKARQLVVEIVFLILLLFAQH